MRARPAIVGLILGAFLVLSSGCASGSEPAAGATPTPDSIGSAPSPDAPTASDVPAETVGPATPTTTARLPTCRGDSAAITEGRTDIRPSGNRDAPGGIDVLTAPISSVQLPGAPIWVVPIVDDAEPCRAHWYVALDDGLAVIVSADGAISDAGASVAPPETSEGTVSSAYDTLDQFENPLPDSRVVSFGQWTAALVEPTDRYAHGVLGDRIEAAGVEIIDTQSGARTRIVVDAPSVIEGISPMLIDVDQGNDAIPEVLVTLSNSDDGAWLALYNLDGSLRARSTAIGRGNRWRNQLGAGFTGPNGELEIVDVRTPHLDGVVEFFRVDGDQLAPVATTSGYTNHVIGSRNLDMGILVDADIDKLREVVLPTRDLGSLAVLDRVDDGVVELGRIDLAGRLNTNIATQWIVGQAWLALGTDDGRLLVVG